MMAMMGRSQGPGLRLTPAVGFSCSCYYAGICIVLKRIWTRLLSQGDWMRIGWLTGGRTAAPLLANEQAIYLRSNCEVRQGKQSGAMGSPQTPSFPDPYCSMLGVKMW